MVHKATTPPDSSSSECQGLSPEQVSNAKAVAAPPRPVRRGHFKSRLGCFSCQSSTGQQGLRPNPSALNLEDLRFYHHFFTVGFPTLPLRGDKVWAQCAAMAHNDQCLAHAILGLGASHISQNCNVDYQAQALSHRVAAIKLVNEQLDNPPQNTIDADALFAAIICLLAQSSLMADSMVEYLTMTRGGNLVATTIIRDFNVSIFNNFSPEGHVRMVKEMVLEQPKDLKLIESFKSSALSLEPLCQGMNEIKYLEAMVSCIESLKESSLSGRLQVFFLPR
ncbi:hypothetical protein QQS21_000862 [Conoideocrella luteorostrata]|uniref:Uncharacterized protein n=1 Tax=Conoideocrella luteorostrata TaxID=1105319 RepID=A0AAJ0CY54_9HYPO|nr:hypothetical protein QQS21_000862 [Conoideocrella luteorostrata]